MAEIWYMKQLRDYEKKMKVQEKEISDLKKRLENKNKEVEGLKDQLKEFAERKKSKRPKLSDYSVGNQEKQLGKNILKKSTGRRTKEEKFKEIDREEHKYPEGISPEKCILANTRIVIHLREGKKEVVKYYIYKKKWSTKRGEIKGVLPRMEYGMEILTSLAFLVYGLNLSEAQASQVLSFFCKIEIGQSEIDSLLQRLSKEWKKEFEVIADIILLALVVYIDETGWKVGSRRCYTWIFSTIEHVLFLYGQSRKEEVLDKILPRGKFKGTGVTDCYKIYENRFTQSQKCWAHYLRTIIKLMLMNPNKKKYKEFFEELFKLFCEGKDVKKDEKINEEEKTQKVQEFKIRIDVLCTKKGVKLKKRSRKDYREFVNLQKNLVRNLNSLFTFVTTDADPTNNQAEREFRLTAQARNNYRTNKTSKGAERRSIVMTVLMSLKKSLPVFSLETITEECIQWREEGKSLFQKQLEYLQLGASP